MAAVEKKTVLNLRVIDLKNELERRGLDKTGIKSVLQEKLKTALEAEGKDPVTFLFEVTETQKKTSATPTKGKLEDDDDEDDDGDLAIQMAELDGNTPSNGDATLSKQQSLENKNGLGVGKDGQELGNPVSHVEEIDAEQEASLAPGSENEQELNLQGEDYEVFDTEGNPDDEHHIQDGAGNDLKVSEIKPATEKLDSSDPQTSSIGRSQPSATSTPRQSIGVFRSTTQLKEGHKEPSTISETGDESFVVQVDDTVLNDIDADLLDSNTQGQGELVGNKGNLIESKQCGSATTEASKLVENSDLKDGTKTSSSKDEKDTKTLAKSISAKPANDAKTVQSSRSLWVSGLSSSTRATDLKTLFSKYGKVLGAKVVTNARSPGSRCYGFVTMSTADEATKAIHLHRTELHGRMISVERAKTEPQGAKAKVLPPTALKSPTKSSNRPLSSKPDKKPITARKEARGKIETSEKISKDVDVLSFEKIKAERERERLRRKELFLRQEERKRQIILEREQYKQRLIEQHQREEAIKLEREKRRLREMRDKLERERVETERLKLETERLQIEREKEKYRREQRALQSRPAIKRTRERPEQEQEWSTKRPVAEKYISDRYSAENRGSRLERKPVHYGEKAGRLERVARGRQERFEEVRPARVDHEVVVRNYGGRQEEHRTVYREEQPRRDTRTHREPARGIRRRSSQNEWKSERGRGSASWSGQVDNEWSTEGGMGQGDGWGTGVGFTVQPGTVMAGPMGTGTVFIAQPASIQGTHVMVPGNMSRHNDSRFGMAAAAVRRY